MSKSLFKRDRVIFISLIDILLQLIFVLMIIILTVFNDYEKTRTSFKELVTTNKDVSVLKKKLDQCEVEASKCKGTLQACIPASNIREKNSVRFRFVDKDTVQFIKFEDAYLDYLKENKDQRRLSMLNIEPMKKFSLEEFNSTFIFVREPTCYHSYSLEVPDSITEGTAKPIRNHLFSLFRSLSPS